VNGWQEGGEARGGYCKRRVEREAQKEQVREVKKGEGVTITSEGPCVSGYDYAGQE
jgi:hypothetical protein